MRRRSNTKNMGFADKMLFILGLILGGVIVTFLIIGVIVWLIKLLMDEKMPSVGNHSTPLPDDDPEAERIAAPFEQRLTETIQLLEDAAAPDGMAKAGEARNEVSA